MGKTPALSSSSSSSAIVTDGQSRQLLEKQSTYRTPRYEQKFVPHTINPGENSKNNVDTLVETNLCKRGSLNDDVGLVKVCEVQDKSTHSIVQRADRSNMTALEANKNVFSTLQSSSSISSSLSSSSSSSIIHSMNPIHKGVIDIETEFIEYSLGMLEDITEVVEKLFQNHDCFLKALKDGVTTFVNKDSSVMYVDKIPAEDINVSQKRNKKQQKKSNKRQKECSDVSVNQSGPMIWDEESNEGSENEGFESSDDVINNETSGPHTVDKVSRIRYIHAFRPWFCFLSFHSPMIFTSTRLRLRPSNSP